MFVRQFFQTRNGRRRAYWALVESYRTERGPRQRLVDVVLPTDPNTEIRGRCITRPSDHQALLLDTPTSTSQESKGITRPSDHQALLRQQLELTLPQNINSIEM